MINEGGKFRPDSSSEPAGFRIWIPNLGSNLSSNQGSNLDLNLGSGSRAEFQLGIKFGLRSSRVC